MKLIAKSTIFTASGRYAPGSTFEADDTDAEVLIAGGFAVEAPPEPTAPPPTKGSKKTAGDVGV